MQFERHAVKIELTLSPPKTTAVVLRIRGGGGGSLSSYSQKFAFFFNDVDRKMENLHQIREGKLTGGSWFVLYCRQTNHLFDISQGLLRMMLKVSKINLIAYIILSSSAFLTKKKCLSPLQNSACRIMLFPKMRCFRNLLSL